MTYQTSLESADIILEITCTNGLTVDTPILGELLSAARYCAAAISLEKIELTLREDGDFDYELLATDGRVFAQVIKGGDDPLMSFAVPDFWKVSEFIRHRPVRDIIVRMIESHGVVGLKLEWL